MPRNYVKAKKELNVGQFDDNPVTEEIDALKNIRAIVKEDGLSVTMQRWKSI